MAQMGFFDLSDRYGMKVLVHGRIH